MQTLPGSRRRSTAHLRTWATPLTIGAFLLMGATGVLMFFEVDGGLTTVIHQWFSWAFLFGATAHIVVHLRSFTHHLRGRWGGVSAAVFLAVFVASCFSWGLITGPQLRRPVEGALADAPLASLASVTRTDPDVLLQRLQAHGIRARADESINQLAGETGISENRLLSLVFLSE